MLSIGDEICQDFVINSDQYEKFIDLFQDKNPMHVDDTFARQHGYEQKIMHGNILNGFLSYFIGECLPFKNVVIISQKISFYKPIYLNSTLELKSKLSGIYADQTVFEFKYKFYNKINDEMLAKGSIQIKRL